MVKPRAGFTIVELLIVIIIIAILAAVTVVAYRGLTNRAQLASAQSDWSNAQKLIETFKVANDVYPVSVTDCPTPAATNICLQPSANNDYVYAAYPAGNGGYKSSPVPQWSLAVKGSGQVYLRSQAVFSGNNEFMQYVDLAPVLDTYGLVKYQLDFDIKSADISLKSTAQVYQQNGSGAKYSGPNVNVPVTTSWAHQSLQFTPTLSNGALTTSWLAFYGTYGTGNILSVSNVVLTVAK